MTAKNRPVAGRGKCCRPVTHRRGEGFWWGLFYGIVPHTFCILFIVFSIVGATVATSVVQRVLYVPYLFQIMVALSLGFATLSALCYLRRNGLLSAAGVRRKWRYLGIMYGTTLAVNLLFFWVVFPAVANLDLSPPTAPVMAQGAEASQTAGGSGAEAAAVAGLEMTLQVAIPCPGHAPLIIGALREVDGVMAATYQIPNFFRVSYDPRVTSTEAILDLPVFEAFPAVVQP